MTQTKRRFCNMNCSTIMTCQPKRHASQQGSVERPSLRNKIRSNFHWQTPAKVFALFLCLHSDFRAKRKSMVTTLTLRNVFRCSIKAHSCGYCSPNCVRYSNYQGLLTINIDHLSQLFGVRKDVSAAIPSSMVLER